MILLIGNFSTYGQIDRREFRLTFRVGSCRPDTVRSVNKTVISELFSFLDFVRNDSSYVWLGAVFSGAASPEGPDRLNRRLAICRREALERRVRERVLIPERVVVRRGETVAWERLADLVAGSDMPYAGEVLEVLRRVPATGAADGECKRRLMALRGGRPWRYMKEHFFPQIRLAQVELVYARPAVRRDMLRVDVRSASRPSAGSVFSPPAVSDAPSAPCSVQEAACADSLRRPFCMALRTNLIGDVLAVPNLGVRFCLGPRWTVGVDWMYGWWKNRSRNRFWRIYGGGITLSRWLGGKYADRPMSGHHVGLFGQLFTYDIEWGGKGRMGGRPGGTLWDRCNGVAGVEYGYSLPVGRRLNFDFTLGVGYWGGRYFEYVPRDGHYVWLATKKRRWIGPVKAEIALTWLLGGGLKHTKK